MDSKAKILSDCYDDSNTFYDYIKSLKEQIASFENDKGDVLSNQQNCNYQNPEVITKYFDEYVENNVQQQRQYASEQAEYQLSLISNHRNELMVNYYKFSSWFIRKGHPDKIVSSTTPKIYSSEQDFNIKNGSFIIDCSGKGKIIFIIILCILFGPAVLAFLVGKFVASLVGALANNETPVLDILMGFCCGVVGLYYWFILLDKIFRGFPWVSWLVIMLGVCVIVFVIIQYTVSHSSLRADADKYMALFYPDDYEDACFNKIMSDYEVNTLRAWDQERSLIAVGGHGPLIDYVISTLKEKYDSAADSFGNMTEKIAQLESELAEYNQAFEYAQQRIKEQSEIVRTPITDSKYNDCVLTSCIGLRIKHDNDNIGVLTHDLHPCICIYNDEEYEDNNALQEAVAGFMLELYYGFINENYHGIIDYNLIDFETGGTLLSRQGETHKLYDAGIINVCRDDNSRKNLYEKIIRQRSLITDSGGMGDISVQNPFRLRNGDEPLPYIIVVHFGNTSWNISTEELQLYNGGDKFGFIPIFIMSQNDYDGIMKNNYNGMQALLNDCYNIPAEWVL